MQASKHARHSSIAYARTRRSRTKKKILIVAIFAAIIAIATFTGVFAYGKIVDTRLMSADTNAASALEKSEDKIQYTLLKADVGVSETVRSSYDTPDNRHIYVLARTDVDNKAISFIVLPTNLAVTCNDNQVHPLYKSEDIGGDAELISSVNNFFSISINHFVSINEEGLKNLVDLIGGVTINLPCAIDDPYASNRVFQAGEINLDGQDALSILRTKNIGGQNATRTNILTLFVASLLDKGLKNEGLDFANTISNLSNTIYCDVTSSDITSAADKMRPFSDIDIRATTISGAISKSTDTSEEVFSPRSSETSALIKNFTGSGATSSKDGQGESGYLETSSIHVEVRNGAGIAGAAATAKTWLETQGYIVDKAGNADEGYIYSETLIVYLGDENKDGAETITSGLGCGRVVNGGDYYTSDSGVIVIIGSDWNPII